ncbi:MAG TPA: alpha-amylase family glycosyl hydrolase, partial [Propionibacteriaceae bacterium]|nr:alpha-amylase family glycosyl hydrolase [Propionibacteriaceae bacterium]
MVTSLPSRALLRPRMSRGVRRVAAATAVALALVTGSIGRVPVAHADGRIVTLVGSLQTDLGCDDNWDPGCIATELPLVSGTTYAKEFTVPAGNYEYKVAINQSWDENYGADGAKGGANIPVTLAGEAKILVSYDDTTHKIAFTPETLAGAASAADEALAKNSLRNGQTRERFYFLMADRFANGDTGNDTGGLSGGPMVTGFDPTNKGFYHGGDLKGVIDKLNYIKGLGTTAIWLTPSFKNKPVQGTGADASAGYHGYWITDFTQIDPHLGTNQDMKNLIAAAHKLGMRVYFDIITNHTADVIQYAGGNDTYIPMSQVPYKDANGNPFNPDTVADTSAFPQLNLQSFPYTPVVPDAEKTEKVPAWLNDPTMYHNRGNSTYAGESATYGDFSGLDDLFTERPDVAQGMDDIYKKWVDFGVDGFRIDTVKNVNLQFWEQFVPQIQAEAAKDGNNKFFMFGEVYDTNPQVESTYTTTGKLPASLDFGFQSAALAEAAGKPTTDLRNFFASDDWFTDTDSNVYESPTFLGNHDMGRIGMMLSNAGFSGNALLQRTLLANDLMYLVRGNPITYYGDEQGFIGQGGDKDAREDMFGTKVTQYADEPLIGGGTMGTGSHYGTTGTIYQHIAGLEALRAKYPALADGAQVHRYASNDAGIYAFSRIDTSTNSEYVVAINNATAPASATFQTYTPNSTWAPLYGTTTGLKSGKDARLSVTVPALSVSVWKARSPMAVSQAAPPVFFTSPSAGATIGGRADIAAAIPSNTFAEVSFAYRPVGTSAWTYLGTDDNAPYQVYADVSALPKNELVEYRVIAKDDAGHISARSTYAQVGTPSTSGGPSTGPVSGSVTQPDAVNVPGTFQSELGCTGGSSGDWDPACPQTALTLDANDQIWKGSFDVPAGAQQYKVAIDNSWTENYGAGGAPNGSNIDFTSPGGPVAFYYDHSTHYTQNTAMG